MSALSNSREVAEIIQRTPLFGRITSLADIAQLCSVARMRAAKSGEVVLEQGVVVAEIYLIVTGRVTVSFSGGTVQSLALSQGSLFGEMEFFERSKVSLGTVRAEEPMDLLCVSFGDLFRVVSDNPITGMQLYHGFLMTLVEKHRLVTDSLIQWKLDRSMQHVAHDLRSPISALRCLAELLAPNDEGKAHQLLRHVIHRLEHITESLSKCNTLQSSALVTDVVSVIKDLVESKNTSCPPGIRVVWSMQHRSIEQKNCRVMCQLEMMSRIVSNIIDNAIEACGDGLHPLRVKMFTDTEKCVIEVRDSGGGFTEEVLAVLGQYPISTKEGHGRGLGLFHATRAVRQWGGTLVVCSTPSSGATVRLTLFVTSQLASIGQSQRSLFLPEHVAAS